MPAENSNKESQEKTLTIEEFYELRQTHAGQESAPISLVPVSQWPSKVKQR